MRVSVFQISVLGVFLAVFMRSSFGQNNNDFGGMNLGDLGLGNLGLDGLDGKSNRSAKFSNSSIINYNL